MCPDLSHPISLIGEIIPHLSNTALFHLWGHIDVNPHLGITTQGAARQNTNVKRKKKFTAAHSSLLYVIALQRSLRHLVSLRGGNTQPLAFWAVWMTLHWILFPVLYFLIHGQPITWVCLAMNYRSVVGTGCVDMNCACRGQIRPDLYL